MGLAFQHVRYPSSTCITTALFEASAPTIVIMRPQRGRPRASSQPASHGTCSERTLEDVSAARLAQVYKVVWQVFLSDYGMWMDYGPSHMSRIERAWQADCSSLQLGDAEYDDLWTINLVSLHQVNNWSETRRPVRRVLVTNS